MFFSGPTGVWAELTCTDDSCRHLENNFWVSSVKVEKSGITNRPCRAFRMRETNPVTHLQPQIQNKTLYQKPTTCTKQTEEEINQWDLWKAFLSTDPSASCSFLRWKKHSLIRGSDLCRPELQMAWQRKRHIASLSLPPVDCVCSHPYMLKGCILICMRLGNLL